uniref:Phospholipase A2 n=1 Tax=Androctonus crassicauda TaxID=122909 RepID=A0AA50AGK6_ANDCR|nr:group 3 secretory phospholipase A2 [Androctonus crassicauda]
MTMKCELLTILLIIFKVLDASQGMWNDADGDKPNFLSLQVLEDNERERRFHLGQVTAVETSVDWEIGPNSTHRGLILRQMTDGKRFIQLIYDSNWELVDCEYLRNANMVRDFLKKFRHDFDCVKLLVSGRRTAECSNATYRLLSDGHLPSDLSPLTNYRHLRLECHRLHNRIKKVVRRQRQDLLNSDRVKRNLFLFPGTNWCGSGSSARKFNELGYNAATDRCCRDHDLCPHTVEAFTHKYGFFNYRFHTISHCDCDERFRACLKLANTATANLVGKLFFNIVQTKCFLFKLEDMCMKRSWWGKCLKSEKEKIAHVQDSLSY